jgi:beta-glucosidase
VRQSRRLSVGVALLAAVLGMAPALAGTAGNAETGACPWVGSTAPTAARVSTLLARMTLADKIAMVHGMTSPAQSVGLQPGAPPYVGEVPGIPRLCIPVLKLEDGPAGVADGMKGVTQLPAPVAAAASWDRSLMTRYGAAVGAEEWGKGANVVLAPTVNIVRDPRWGRAFESLGEDPYLTSQLAVADIEGIQGQGPMAQVKHLAAYNEETFRDTPLNDAIVSPRTLQEVYLPAFQSAVQEAQVASVMCAYNELNHVPDCANPYLDSQVLKGEFGFPGFLTSDWFAQTSSAAAAEAGLDLEMPDGCLLGTQLQPEVQAGAVRMARLDDMVSRILTEMFRFGLFNRRQTGSPRTVVTSPAHTAFARTAAEDGTVLLKNAGGMLPLDPGRTKSIAVIGADGGSQAQTAGGGSASVVAPYAVSPYRGIVSRAGRHTRVVYDDGSSPAQAAAAARASDVAVVFASLFDQEDRDQTTLLLPAGENALITAVAAANPNTVVVLNTGSAVVMPWLGQVRGLLEAWYPGQEDGNALAALLFGDVDPSGKLPVTFPASAQQTPTSSPDRWPGVAGQTRYSEGLLVGYRWYDAGHVSPAFPFGFGLSYTTFAFHHLTVGSPSTSDGRESVKVEVTNTGRRAGAEVVQLYAGDPSTAGEPLRTLAGFQKVWLAPGQTAQVSFSLGPRALSYWDQTTQRWSAVPGIYRVAAGDSSRNLPLTAAFTLTRTVRSGTPPTAAPPSLASSTAAGLAASDATTCWQDDLATLVNGGLSLTGSRAALNPSQLPVG